MIWETQQRRSKLKGHEHWEGPKHLMLPHGRMCLFTMARNRLLHFFRATRSFCASCNLPRLKVELSWMKLLKKMEEVVRVSWVSHQKLKDHYVVPDISAWDFDPFHQPTYCAFPKGFKHDFRKTKLQLDTWVISEIQINNDWIVWEFIEANKINKHVCSIRTLRL